MESDCINGKNTYAVIRAIYESRNAPEEFEKELDFVLAKRVGLVIIEPDTLGEQTWRWIRTGNFLHKTAVVCGFGALLLTTSAYRSLIRASHHGGADLLLKNSYIACIFCPRVLVASTGMFLSLVSVTSATLYDFLWQTDPCSKYQVVQSLSALPKCLLRKQLLNNKSRNIDHQQHSSPSSLVSSSSIIETSSESAGPPLKPVVIVHRDDSTRKIVHNSVALLAGSLSGLVLFRYLKLHTPLR